MTKLADDMRSLAYELQRQRAERGVSLRDAGRESGVAFNTIARFERQRCFPMRSLRAVAKIANWCGYELTLRPKEKQVQEGLGLMSAGQSAEYATNHVDRRQPPRLLVRLARNGYLLEVHGWRGEEPELWVANDAPELGELVQQVIAAHAMLVTGATD